MKALRIVVAAVLALRHRHPAEFAAPDHQRRLQQAALFQIGEQAVDRHVGRQAMAGVIAGQIAVSVPFAVAVDLHEPHAAFDQPPGQQALRAVRLGFRAIQAVHPLRRRGLLREIDQLGGFGLHAIRQLERLDAPEQFRFAGMRPQMLGVESCQQIELPPLIVAGDVARAD